MTELPDDELDKLFRKSEELDPDYEPEDWNALKKRLDQHDGKTPMGMLRKWWPLGLLALFISVAVTVYLLTDRTELSKDENHVSTQIMTGYEKNKKAELKGQVQLRTDKQDGSEIVPEQQSVQAKSDEYDYPEKELTGPVEKTIENKTIKKLPRSHSKTGGVYLEPDRSERKGGDGAFSFADSNAKNTAVYAINKGEVNHATDVKTKILEGKAANPDIIQAEEIPVITGEKVAAGDEVISNNRLSDSHESQKSENERLQITAESLTHRPLAWISLMLPEINISPVFEAVAEPVRIENKKQEIPKWAVRLGYSPDLSTVGLKNFSKPRAAGSLLLEYAVFSRLYVQTGVISSVKAYRANAGEYKLSKYVTQIATPETIDGTCNMLEIPLGFRYDITQTARSRWFGGAGFSSFYIKKEKYIYNYSEYVKGAKPGWEGKSGWTLLSHLNISAGYEYRISRKLSLLAEPYIKIPLKGIGYGKVDLTTLGMWLSVRYTPVFK